MKIEEQSKTSKSCFGGFCPNCVNHYRISRKSTKKVRSITGLQEQAGNRLDSSPNSSSRHRSFFTIRGIGKIELAKEVGRRVKVKNLFDEVVVVVADPKSSTCDIRNIQNQIADMLGMKIQEESETGRARRLCLRLKMEKKILIIFDNVREKLDLKAIGIPLDNKGCKMIVTENENLWKSMEDGVKKVEIQALSEEESWMLFKSVTCEIVDNDSDFKIVAEEIVGK
ncbi:hypothetical protein K1719_001072 [Acacia pycnantha]|nr:hypothetical protein K1719_001072 [Acacia pycnantha]